MTNICFLLIDKNSIIVSALRNGAESSMIIQLDVSKNIHFVEVPIFVQYVLTLELIHHAIHIIKTTCTASADGTPYHDLKWMFDCLCNTVKLILFDISSLNKWKLVCIILDAKLLWETNLKNFPIRFKEALLGIEICISTQDTKMKNYSIHIFPDFSGHVSMLFGSRVTLQFHT